MKVLIAPDSFKGSIGALSAADALSAGWKSVRPEDTVVALPMADGGEGTIDACVFAAPLAIRHPVRATGPDGVRVDAEWLELPGKTKRGLVELASSSGIGLLNGLLPFDSHTVGFGEAIRDAIEQGCDELLLALGGSASTDGGLGLLTALGAKFLDRDGLPVRSGNHGLGDVASVDTTELLRPPPGGATLLSDVTNPLLGPEGAVNVFGAQKGITEAYRAIAERRLAHYVAQLPSDLSADTTAPGSGAAGGAGYALLAWGARFASGSHLVGDLLRLPQHIATSDIVITGEGRYDSQSLHGKVVGHVASIARAMAVPCHLVAGQFEETSLEGSPFVSETSLTVIARSVVLARQSAEVWLREAGRLLALQQ